MKLKLKALRIAFFGTSSFAAYHLYMLIHCSIQNIVAVFTQEKQPLHQKTLWSVFKIAEAYKLNLFSSYTILTSEIIFILNKLKVDIIVVVSYGVILPAKILTIPTLGCINVHGSLLPRWRGAAPIQRAIEYGDSITGISIIYMDSGIDTGNILYSKTCKISSTDNSYTLSEKLAQIGATGLLKTIENLTSGTHACHIIQQNFSHATYACKLTKLEARINWKLSAIILDRQIRAFNPWPISYFYVHGKRIRIWTAKISNQKNKKNQTTNKFLPGTVLKIDESGIYVATGSGILVLVILQIPGKQKTSVKNILNAYNHWFQINTLLQ